MFRTYELLSPTLLIAEPKLINQVLIEDFPKFSSHRVIMKIFNFVCEEISILFFKDLCIARTRRRKIPFCS
jgi:hypothetical protein